ncbi:MAG: phosphatidylinositol-specific phospholipase C [Clostridia bacterium]|nr:phosphatidylinositol-specific phospholipase C [Clostridia bacterium]
MTRSKRLKKPRAVTILLIALAVCAALIIWWASTPLKNNENKETHMDQNSPNIDWMSKLDDALTLNELSIPATHDSGATISFMGISGQCQKTTIKEQLYMGVRFFDIRLRLVNDELTVFHGFVDQNLTFASVLEDINEFIEKYPSEFLIMSIKQEDDPKDSTLIFHEKVEADLAQFPLISGDREFPATVGEARGKIYIFSRYGEASIGVPASPGWMDSTSFELNGLYVQDKYRITDITQKTEAFEKALEIAAEKKYTLVLNFASCYLENALPPASASKTAKEINPYLLKLLRDQKSPVGVILCDYITDELCDVIIKNNF